MFNQKTVKKLSSYIFIYSVGLSAIGLLFFYIIPVTKDDKSAWVIGEMSSSHKFIEKNCALCHKDEFEPIENKSCTNCHALSTHVLNDEIAEDTVAKIEARSCVSCHFEHSGETNLIIKDDKMCVDCHGDLNRVILNPKVENVKNFDKHPEFRYLSFSNPNLKLNHNVHLAKDIRGENGYETLGCADCHSVQQNGAILPVNYEKNCRSCHKLEIEYRNTVKNVPHVNQDQVFSELFKEYSAAFFDKSKTMEADRLRPGKNTMISESELRIEKSIILSRARNAEEEMFLKVGCNLCHEVKEKVNFDIESNENVSKFEIIWNEESNESGTRRAFNHSMHDIVSCESCHEDIRKSENFDKKSFPNVNTCHTCHSSLGGATQNCTSCHAYHESVDFDEASKKSIVDILSKIK